jgi:predicted nucleotidyltransferase
VLLVGSLVAGLATSSSDIDLLLVADREDVHEGFVIREPDFEQSVLRHPDGYLVNVEVWSPGQLEEMGCRFASAIACLRQPEAVHDLHVMRIEEITLLHRLETGIALANAGRAQAWRHQLGVDWLPTYLMLRGAWNGYAHVLDVEGELEHGSPASCFWITRVCMDQLASALLASIGETNPSERWRVRMLERHRDTLGSRVVDALLEYLFLCPASSPIEMAAEAIDFARAQLDQLLGSRPEIRVVMSALTLGSTAVSSA